MKYWILFTMRLLARAGLCLVVILYVTVQQKPVSVTQRLHGAQLGAFADHSSVRIGWQPAPQMGGAFHFTSMLMLFSEPLQLFPGVRVWTSGWRQMVVQADYWILCPIFLIATVATSRRWKKTESKIAASVLLENRNE